LVGLVAAVSQAQEKFVSAVLVRLYLSQQVKLGQQMSLLMLASVIKVLHDGAQQLQVSVAFNMILGRLLTVSDKEKE
jgi:hypothetical protein